MEEIMESRIQSAIVAKSNPILHILQERGHLPLRIVQPPYMDEQEFREWAYRNHYEMFITFDKIPFVSPQPTKEWWIHHLNTSVQAMYGTYAPSWSEDPTVDTDDLYTFFSRLMFELSVLDPSEADSSATIMDKVRGQFHLATHNMPESFLFSLYQKELSAREVAEAIYFLHNRNVPARTGKRWYHNINSMSMVLRRLPHNMDDKQSVVGVPA